MAEFYNVITDIAGLREIISSPSHLVLNKVTDRIDELGGAVHRSLALRGNRLAQRRRSSRVSPKGDAAGSFVKIIDQQMLAVPDRLGNRRLVPGKRETLRISGTAKIVRDQWLREELTHQGKLPDIAIIVTIKRLYFHCAQCMIRSQLWQPDGWPATDHLPSLAGTMVAHGRLSESERDAVDACTDRGGPISTGRAPVRVVAIAISGKFNSL
jgi:uncharacterized protein